MFDNFLVALKNRTNNLSDSLKARGRKFTNNLNALKSNFSHKTKTTYYTIVQKDEVDLYENDYLSPRAYSMTTFSMDYNAVNENMEWFPYVPPSYDEHNVIDRFIRVITINDDSGFDRRTDREEIRRRLAMGSDDDCYSDRPGRKPSLQARLQSGMNLQICFMNETASDNESPSSDNECPLTNPKPPKKTAKMPTQRGAQQPAQRPATLALHSAQAPLLIGSATTDTCDFFTQQARLQTEARMALAQAKEMARMQMEIERQRTQKSPITEMVRTSLAKVGVPFPEERRRLSRLLLTEMNVAQLQLIVNELHTQIETLNELLVRLLMDRDDLHMEQDSMLVDIEDLTRYLGAKEQVLKVQPPTPQNNNMVSTTTVPQSAPTTALAAVRPHLNRIASLVKK